jgi:triacylglycerol lipase
MNSEHLLDPDLRALVAMWPPLELDESMLPLIRDTRALPMPEIADPERVDKSAATAPGRDGAPDVPLIVYRPAGRTDDVLPCIYHIHGGGYVLGSAAMMEPMHRQIADTLGCMIVSVEYRLAPETPHPGPVEDCYTGLAWLFANADALGVDAQRIGVMGESAGGGLAAGLALLARDRGEYALAFQHLIYPMIDDRTCTADPNRYAGDYIWTPEANRFGWRCYLGTEPGAASVSPYAAAARATDLAGLPPTFIATGALDLFVDEDVDYARRLIRAGVPTELHVYPGAVHGFDMSPTPVAQRAMRDSHDALGRFLRPGG